MVVIFNLGFAKVCSPAINETYFPQLIAVTDYYMYLVVIFLLASYTSIDKSYSFIISSLLTNAVILLLN